MMISSRYALAFIAIASIALAPTLIHSYARLRSEDGRSARSINRALSDFNSKETERKASWVEETFQSQDWIERHYSDEKEEPLLLFVARSYDPKRLYHHPELALLYGTDLEALGTVRLPGMTEKPIHLLKGKQGEGKKGVAVYALLYDGEFVEQPLLFQLKNALSFVFQARKPMTLFLVYDASPAPEVSLEESRVLLLLNAAIADFLSQTPDA